AAPPGAEVLLVLGDDRLGVLEGVVPLAEGVEQVGAVGADVRVVGRGPDGIVEGGEGLGVLALGAPGGGGAGGRGGGGLGVLGRLLERGPGLGVVPALEPLFGRREGAVGLLLVGRGAGEAERG